MLSIKAGKMTWINDGEYIVLEFVKTLVLTFTEPVVIVGV